MLVCLLQLRELRAAMYAMDVVGIYMRMRAWACARITVCAVACALSRLWFGPSAHETSLGIPSQVWFQNARAKEKKSKLAFQKTFGSEVEFSRPPEECKLCNFKYSHKYTGEAER